MCSITPEADKSLAGFLPDPCNKVAGAASFALVVLWLGHCLHDDGLGSRDNICASNRTAAEPVVRPALCHTAAWYDPGQLHDRHCPRSRHADNGADEPARKC